MAIARQARSLIFAPQKLRWYQSHEPELYRVELVPWQLFVHLSSPDPDRPAGLLWSQLHRLLRSVAKKVKIHYRDDLLHCFRIERGPTGGGLHLHGVVAGLGPSANLPRLAREMAQEWRAFAGGSARVRRYRYVQTGVAYCLKRSRQRDQRNSDDFIPRLSPALLSYIQ